MQNKVDFLKLFKDCLEHLNSERLNDAAACLKDMFLYLTRETKINDGWSFEWYEPLDGIYISATSQKQLHKYDIGIFDSEFYINSTLYEPDYLKNMKPQFWSVLASLDIMECFCFEENAGLDRNVDFDLKTGQSSMYSLIKKLCFTFRA